MDGTRRIELKFTANKK